MHNKYNDLNTDFKVLVGLTVKAATYMLEIARSPGDGSRHFEMLRKEAKPLAWRNSMERMRKDFRTDARLSRSLLEGEVDTLTVICSQNFLLPLENSYLSKKIGKKELGKHSLS